MAACILDAMVSHIFLVASCIGVSLMTGQLGATWSAWSVVLGAARSGCLTVSVKDTSPSGGGASVSAKANVEFVSSCVHAGTFWLSGTSGTVSSAGVSDVLLSSLSSVILHTGISAGVGLNCTFFLSHICSSNALVMGMKNIVLKVL